ncbi:sulfate ABC transporter substrate-binding protein [Patulibacter sp. NPDC049589]|uniref:sulfate ABC transporter substrate-binding protein n=1 Tax=Patulibacter sp. NPDC049589 TaxID=3154731 RepID=UPI00344981EB
MRPTPRLLAPAALLATAALAGCGGSSDSTSDTSSAADSGPTTTKLSLVAYSTPQVVYDDAGPAFKATTAGKGVQVSGSFGASGDQSRSVLNGANADVVAFSLEPDMTKLVKPGLVADDWNSGPNKGFVSNSVATFVVRKGNPKNITTWDDLIKPGVKVITPNPFSSGSAKWNLLAGYGAKSDGGKDPAAGLAYVKTLLTKNVKQQPASGRDASSAFTTGDADVLISYENEAITLQQKGAKVDYVTPDATILIQNPIAVTAKSKHPEQAKAFVDYLLSKPGQEIFAKHGYRPVDDAVLQEHATEFPQPKGIFTIDDLGGWSKVNDEFFDPDKGSIAKIEQDAGVSTSK